MFKSHHARGFLICLTITMMVLVFHLTGALELFELKSIDQRFLLRGNRPVHPDIAVITIDEDSIEKYGRWPWPRKVHGELIRRLTALGASVIAFDTLFTEPDKSNPASDAALVNAVKASDRVVSAFFFNQVERNTYGTDPLFPFEKLNDASHTGYVNLEPDRDGVTRRAPLVLMEKDGDGKASIYPSLAVMAYALHKNLSIEDVLSTLPIQIDLNFPDLIKTTLLVNYTYDADSFMGYSYSSCSFAELLEAKTDYSELFKGKVVFVGATAAALFDLKATPFTSILPGVMIHANVLDNLLTGNPMKEVSPEVTVLYVLLVGLLMGFSLPRFRPWVKLGVFVLVAGGGLWVAQWAFVSHSLILPVVAPLLVSFGCYGGILFYQLVIEEREKRKIKGSFRQYLSPKIIDVITKDPSKLKLGGEEREVSIFFLDIAGFTTMSETLKPSQLVEVMNNCLTEFSNVIMKHDGLINKYIGDCIMAFWNAPADQPNHASQACQAALECISVLPEINRRFQEKGLPAIDCRVGINTGVVVVGNMGSNERFDYTVLGDPVNLASRLEGANKQYHTRIMISDVTFEKAKDAIQARDLDLIRVKGKKEPRKVFEVLCRSDQMNEELEEGRRRYHQGLSLYRQRYFDDAIEAFEKVFEYLPNDHVTRVYLERARHFKNHPPPANWDGVYEMTTK